MATGHEGKNVRKEEGEKERASGLLTFSPSYLLFFVLCFVYLWLVVEPDLIYHGFGTLLPDAPLFATGWSFLQDSLTRPGGLVIYASAFLSQGYYYPWLGALIIVLAGFCLSELSRRHLVTAGFARASILAPLPAIMLFIVYSQYNHPLSVCLAVSLGLLLSLIFGRLPSRRPLVRTFLCCLMALVGLWAGGAGAVLVFALMTVVYGIFVHRDWATTVVVLPASVAIAWVLAQSVFLIPAHEALLVLTPFAPSATTGMDTLLKVLVFLLYGFVPVAALLAFLGKWVFTELGHKSTVPSKKAREKKKHKTGDRGGRTAIFRLLFSALRPLPVVPIVLMALGLCVSHKELRKPYVLSNYYSRQRNWDKIIELSRRLPKGKANAFVSHDILRALYHTGRLPYDMFRHPLIPEAILLTHEKRESDLTQWKLSDIFLELGHVNMAQKLASELLTTKGRLGIVVEKLGWISIIKGCPRTARVYLAALKKDPIYRERAQSLLAGLDSGFTGDQAAYIDRIRSYLRDETAGVTGTEPVDETLAALLEHNPRNKMAFEYLMACYLLTGRVDKIVENMPRLRDLGYQRIPTLYEEAILIHYGTQGREIDLARFNIGPETLQRYETFVQIAGAMQSQNRPAVLNRMVHDFGTSYFFYYSFGRVGL